MKSIAASVTPTLDDVAARAGVSKATASRAISRPDLVARSTRQRVERAVEELQYHPNEMARGLRQRASRTIGLVLTDFLNPFQATVAKGAQDAAFALGYNLIICNTNEDSSREKGYLLTLRANQVQGLILIPTEHSSRNLRSVRNLPVVEVDRVSGTAGSHAVLVDNVEGSSKAVRHLIGLGHEKIGMISGKREVTTGSERLEGYLQAMREASILVNPDWIVEGNHTSEAGLKAAAQLLALPSDIRPTAFFCFNNEMTAGALLQLRKQGLRVPHDISVVGFDDSPWAQLVDPPLTVVAQPAYEIGYMASERLLGIITRKTSDTSVSRLATRLIVRESTRAPAHD